MGSANRDSRPDLLPAEFRSGPFLSEAQSVMAPAAPEPPPVRRGMRLQTKLVLFLLLCGLSLAFFLSVIATDLRARQGEEELLGALRLSQKLVLPELHGGCAALRARLAGRAAEIRRDTGYDVALFSGEQPLVATKPPAGPVRDDVLRRALEGSAPLLLRPSLLRGSDVAGFIGFRGLLPDDCQCQRLVLALGRDRGFLQDPRSLLLTLSALLFSLGSTVILLPLWLTGLLKRLHRQVSLTLERQDKGDDVRGSKLPRGTEAVEEDLLERGDEVGDLSRAFAHLIDAVRDNEARLFARVRELTTLHAIGRAISSVLDLEEALRKIVSEVVTVFAARKGALVLISPDMRYRLGASIRIDAAAADAVAALGEVLVRRGGRVLIDDLSRDAELQAAARHGGLSGSLLAAPLDQQGRILGLLLITRSRSKPPFAEADLQLLSTVADQASIAISNARLYAEVQRSSEELELRVEERTMDLVMANEELNRALENLHKAQAQLLVSERLAGLGHLVAGVAHEINSPAGAIQGAADALQENVARIGARARELAELPLPEGHKERLLALCDQVAARLSSGNLLAPAQVRRLGRDYATDLFDLCREPGDNAQLFDSCRTLAELGVEDREVLAVLAAAAERVGAGAGGQRPVEAFAILVGYLEQRIYLHRNAHAIRTAIGQITRIVGALKSYSHLDQARVELTNVHEGLETTLVILHSELKYGILLTRKYGTVPTIHAYVDELNQVWTNLLHNAIQALQGSQPPVQRKSILIETGHRPAASGDAAAACEDGGEVWVAIEDNGPGIPEEVLPRIFEPFFTTKQKGEGTGLGLGIAQGIVARHGGRIEVSSQPGRTRFTVWLPVKGPALGAS